MASIVDKSGQRADVSGLGLADRSVKDLIAWFVELLVLNGHTKKAVAKGFGRSVSWVDLCLRRATPPVQPTEEGE